MHIAIYPDLDSLSQDAAKSIVRLANEAIVSHGRFTIALSGGSSPRKLYGLLGSEPYRSQIDWSSVEVFWSDERCVPPDSDESNYRMAHDVLLSKVPIPAGQIHRMQGELADRNAAAERYSQELQRTFVTNGIPSFDLMQLGMGPDGHTCSLFPHQSSLHENQRLVIHVSNTPKPPPDRLTFTAPVLNAARHTLFLVTGADKADAVHAVIEGAYQPDEYPSQLVRPTTGEVTWMLDTDAAAKLTTTMRKS